MFLSVWVMKVTIEHHFTTLYLQLPTSGHLMFCPRNFYHLLLQRKKSPPQLETREILFSIFLDIAYFDRDNFCDIKLSKH